MFAWMCSGFHTCFMWFLVAPLSSSGQGRSRGGTADDSSNTVTPLGEPGSDSAWRVSGSAYHDIAVTFSGATRFVLPGLRAGGGWEERG